MHLQQCRNTRLEKFIAIFLTATRTTETYDPFHDRLLTLFNQVNPLPLTLKAIGERYQTAGENVLRFMLGKRPWSFTFQYWQI